MVVEKALFGAVLGSVCLDYRSPLVADVPEHKRTVLGDHSVDAGMLPNTGYCHCYRSRRLDVHLVFGRTGSHPGVSGWAVCQRGIPAEGRQCGNWYLDLVRMAICNVVSIEVLERNAVPLYDSHLDPDL